jgi:hypothetical protein
MMANAVQSIRFETIDYLIQRGVNINAALSSTDLRHIYSDMPVVCIQELIARGLNWKFTRDEVDPVHIDLFCLGMAFSPSLCFKVGYSALRCAILRRREHIPIIELLINPGQLNVSQVTKVRKLPQYSL